MTFSNNSMLASTYIFYRECTVIGTMSAKSLGTLAMIYATDELQNPLPLKTMLCEGDMNNSVRRSDVFLYN